MSTCGKCSFIDCYVSIVYGCRAAMFLHTLSTITLLLTVVRCHDLCNPDQMIQNNVTHYKYKQEPIHHCGCQDSDSCVKKCCARGYNIEKKRCVLTEGQEFNLPLFSDTVPLKNITPENYFVGVLKHCDFYPRIADDPEDRFHLQEDLSLYLPHEGQYVEPNDFCLDYTSQGVLIAILCISKPKTVLAITINYVGM